MPGFEVGGLRLWNSGSRWSKLEPQRGVYDWPKLDRHVEPAERAGVSLLFTLSGTPGWASPDGPEMNFFERPRTSAPDDLAVWEGYVHTVATRYRGRIQAYEVWDAANVEAGYSGTVETMVELASRVDQALYRSARWVPPLWNTGQGFTLRRVSEGLLLQLGQRQAPDHVAAARRPSDEGGVARAGAGPDAEHVLRAGGEGRVAEQRLGVPIPARRCGAPDLVDRPRYRTRSRATGRRRRAHPRRRAPAREPW
ncbi:beta-galactosidase [Allokutzneria sp. A3M-2-11 16]|uniref:beta-galactosidase n=1 Tax=Allokutzneria sp. A3M-2-11 16 TaxID=2962043 RepID=UPI0020B7CF68|nr:beta-galactosidase [Allokutzneria sp. A3M-2-11 16]MCP3801321.1 beta-galactosidase [Allokutzneria sp. A3M-2-11 16]